MWREVGEEGIKKNKYERVAVMALKRESEL